MAKSVFRVRDKVSGTYWNGETRWSKFGTTGKAWKSKAAAENNVSYVTRYRRSYPNLQVDISTDNWEIVEFAITETETATHDISKYVNHCKLKEEISKVDHLCGYFMDVMYRKGVADQVQFLFKLKVPENQYRINMDQIKEARASLRQLKVKTRSFRESSGVFGMLDREQAMKARLTLDPDIVIDVQEIRTRLGI